jgi:hypothetical protein
MVHCNRRRRGRIHILTTNYSAGKRSSPRAAGEAIKRRDEGEETRAKIARRYECFCLHARNLINFFWEDKPPNAKDAVARHFTDASYNPFGGICPQEKTRGLYGKLNKQITHITYDRTNDEAEKLGSDDREFLYNRLKRKLKISKSIFVNLTRNSATSIESLQN